METHTNSQNFRNVKVTRKINSTDCENAIERFKDQATKSAQEDALVYGAEEGRDKLR